MKRKLLVNKSFQFRSGAMIILLTLAMSAPLVALLGVNAYYNGNNIYRSMNSLETALADEQRIIDDFIAHSRKIPGRWVNDDGTLGFARLNVKEITRIHDGNAGVIREFSGMIRDTTERNTMLVYIVIGIIALQTVMLFLFMLRFTHRIAGPVYHMERMLGDMSEGKTPDTRPLRDRDRLKNLHAALVKLYETQLADRD